MTVDEYPHISIHEPAAITNHIIEEITTKISKKKLSKHHHLNYQKRVSFDNVTNIPPAYHSFTLKQSSRGFERTRRSRTFMVAIDLFQGTLDSLSFTLRNLIDENDEIVVVGVYSPNQISTTDRDEMLAPKEKAQQIMDWIMNSHQGDNINMVVELTFGRPEVALEEMMRMYQPSLLIVGSRNKSKYKHAYSGAGIFKYRLKHSTVPVVIVRDKGPNNSISASTGDLITATSSYGILPDSSIEPTHASSKKRVKKSFSLFNCTYYYTSE